MKATGCRNTYQKPAFFCASTILTRLNEPASIKTPSTDNPRATSQLTICAAERNAPSNGYLLFEAHPARIMPSTPTDEIDSTYNRPIFRSVTYIVTCRPKILMVGPTGIT